MKTEVLRVKEKKDEKVTIECVAVTSEVQEILRISKSIVVNLRKIQAITPALNARYMANLKNGEQLIISRQYVKHLKEILLGGQKNEV